jgi:hypothetical protein
VAVSGSHVCGRCHRGNGQQEFGEKQRVDHRCDDKDTRIHRCAGSKDASRQSILQTPLLLRQSCKAQRNSGGSGEASKDTCHDGPIGGAANLHRKISEIGDSRDQNDHPPDFIGIEYFPRSVTLVGQDRKQDDRNQEQLECRAQLLLFNLLDPGMKRRLVAQKEGRYDGRGDGEKGISKWNQRSEAKGQKTGHGSRDADVFAILTAPQVARSKYDRDGHQAESQEPFTKPFGDQGRAGACKPDEPKRTQSGHSRALRPFSLFPAPLQANQQANSQGNAEKMEWPEFVSKKHTLAFAVPN